MRCYFLFALEKYVDSQIFDIGPIQQFSILYIFQWNALLPLCFHRFDVIGSFLRTTGVDSIEYSYWIYNSLCTNIWVIESSTTHTHNTYSNFKSILRSNNFTVPSRFIFVNSFSLRDRRETTCKLKALGTQKMLNWKKRLRKIAGYTEKKKCTYPESWWKKKHRRKMSYVFVRAYTGCWVSVTYLWPTTFFSSSLNFIFFLSFSS